MTKEFPPPKSALIVGAGILGAAIAYRLAKAGLAVTILDKAGPAAGASGASWAWINALSAGSKPYFDLRQAGIAAHHDLEQELSGRWPVDWSGLLTWDESLFDDGEQTALQQAWGHVGKAIDAADARGFEPLLGDIPGRLFHSPDDGLLDATAATHVLLDEASAAGARLLTRSEAKRLLVTDGVVSGVETDVETLEADVTIVVSGTGAPALLEGAGVALPMDNTRGLLLTTKPVEARLSCAIWTEAFSVKQFRDGRLCIVDPTARSVQPGREAAMIAGVEALLPGLGPLTVERADRPTRPIPADGLPVIGAPDAVGGLYVAVMHSGVTLCALVGRLAEAEILRGQSSPLLDAFRVERFGGAA